MRRRLCGAVPAVGRRGAACRAAATPVPAAHTPPLPPPPPRRSIRLLADSIGLFGSAEKITWLANRTPQEAGRLAPPALPGFDDQPPASTAGKKLPKDEGFEHDMQLAHAPKLPAGWPRSGGIVFDRVVMKYAPHLPPALNGVSFKIKSGEKVGGR